MKFIPFKEAQGLPECIVVDAYLPGRLNLSHWRGVELSSSLIADTSTEIVLNAIEKQKIPKGATCCTNNHFDIDGFLGAWALHNPKLALVNRDLLKLMARLGDFREMNNLHPLFHKALSLVCWINEEEKKLFYPPFGKGVEEEVACVPKYEYFLGNFEESLMKETLNISAEYELVLDQLNDFDNNGGEVRHLPEIRLAIVKAPYPMHYYPLFATTENADIVLTIYPENRYEIEEKYSTWVETKRKSFPRLELSQLAKVINSYEQSDGKWFGDHFTDTGPLLRITNEKLDKEARFDHPMNRTILSSSIPGKQLAHILVEYLKRKYKDSVPMQSWSWGEVRIFNDEVRNF